MWKTRSGRARDNEAAVRHRHNQPITLQDADRRHPQHTILTQPMTLQDADRRHSQHTILTVHLHPTVTVGSFCVFSPIQVGPYRSGHPSPRRGAARRPPPRPYLHPPARAPCPEHAPPSLEMPCPKLPSTRHGAVAPGAPCPATHGVPVRSPGARPRGRRAGSSTRR
jgi:hypothetical protein